MSNRTARRVSVLDDGMVQTLEQAELDPLSVKADAAVGRYIKGHYGILQTDGDSPVNQIDLLNESRGSPGGTLGT